MKFSIPRSGFLALAFLLGIGLASAVSWILISNDQGGQSTDTDPVASSPSSAPNLGSERLVPTGSEQSSPRRNNAENLEDIEQLQSPFDQLSALYSLLARMDARQALDLLEESKDRLPAIDIKNLQLAIIQRLAQFDPKLALVHALDLESHGPSQYVSSVFREWAQVDLDDAVANARSLDEHLRTSVVDAILSHRSDLSPDVQREIAQKITNEPVADALLAMHAVSRAKKDAEQVWNELASKLQDNTRQTALLSQVAIAWIDQSGPKVLEQIAASLTNSYTRQNVLQSVLDHVAITEPARAFEFALNNDTDFYNQIKESVVSAWAQTDPQTALNAVGIVRRGPLRKLLEKSIIRSWAEQSPRAVLERIDSLPPVHKEMATLAALGAIALNSPSEAVQVLSTLESGQTRRNAASQVVSVWSSQNAREALDWILNEPSIQDLKSRLLRTIANDLVHVDPHLAMSAALELPAVEASGMEAHIVHQLAWEDSDKAIELVGQVRYQDAKMRSYRNLGLALVSKGDGDKAMDLSKDIPEPLRVEYFQLIIPLWARDDAEGLLELVNQLPTQKFKSQAARELIQQNRWTKSLTETQLEAARTYLSETDAKLLK